jgi:hypothetical protein
MMTTILREPAIGPAVWRKDDFEGDASWAHRLTEQQIGEIESALRLWKSKGLKVEDIDRSLACFPSLDGLLATVRSELIEGRGFSVMRGLPVDRFSEEDTGLIFWAFGTHLGDGITQNGAGDLLCHVADRGMIYGEGNTRAYQSRAGLKFHGDNADVAALLCYRKAKSGGESFIVSALSVYNEIVRQHPEYLETLYEGFIYDRRGEQGPGEPAESRRIPVFTYTDGDLSCRFARGYIDQYAKRTATPLTALQEKALAFFDETSWRSDLALQMQLQPGDIQWLNNYTVLHTRNEFEDYPEPERRRLLMRLWLIVPGVRRFRPKDDIFRYEFIQYGNLGRTAEQLRTSRPGVAKSASI